MSHVTGQVRAEFALTINHLKYLTICKVFKVSYAKIDEEYPKKYSTLPKRNEYNNNNKKNNNKQFKID